MPKWDNPEFMLNGEYIMGTHDAYYWLAGAKGVGSAVGNPMSTLVHFLGSVTGAQYGNIAFWLPAVFAGFCAISAFAWGMLVAGPWVGLVSAIYATSIPAYYFRTRLSYYDTDVVTLFFPLVISVLLARWVSLGIRKSWLPQKSDVAPISATVWDYLVPIVAGMFTFYGKFWHADVLTFGLLASLSAFGLIIVCGSKQTRSELIRGMILYALVAFMGLIGFALALGLIYFYICTSLKKNLLYNNIFFLTAVFVSVFILSGMGQNLLWELSIKFASYLKPVAGNVTGLSGPLYPGIAQSIIEAQNISFDALFANLTGSQALGWLGFAGFGFATLLSPRLIFLMPFAIITFAAVTMGGRFSMFGGVALGIGLSFVAHWLICKWVKATKNIYYLSVAQAVVIIFLLFVNVGGMYKNAPATPIMGPAHAEALLKAGKFIEKGSTVWTWWDWGYATMYYTGAESFANGGHHGGPVLFPLGLSYAASSFMHSNQLINFSAVNGNSPSAAWDKMSPVEVEKLIRSFGTIKYKFSKAPKQYMVVSWANLRLAYWILYYGSWNVQTGSGVHPNVRPIMKQFDLDFEKGVLTIQGERPLQLSSYDMLEPTQRVTKRISTSAGPHLLYNQAVGQGFIVDEFAYSSMLVRLLIDNPQESSLSANFKLVYEGFPLVRIYEVL
ncbi:STT3 domain-containing protein [Maridesulfovibrio frigidus]|uniref:STT3 domain-containing protein n=1 Tax=Maridesulfovibrio frigidus TaxID=340956 RepID=UPI0012EC596C|nr:STT3 domain-containing protein [Maridesulfovibrio frigidus]